MAEQLARTNFYNIFSNLNQRVEIIDCKWTIKKCPQNTFFELKCRTQIQIEKEDYNKYCDKWVDEFSSVTDTVWAHKTSNTGPIVKFRKQYQCWTHQTKEIDKTLLFDPRRCRGTIDIKILGDGTRSVKKSNRFLRLGMNALIKINFQHLHWLDTNQDYSFFVHCCKPLPEAPKPAVAPSQEKISQLVSKVIETAPVTAQKAAERAKEALERNQCGQETSSDLTSSDSKIDETANKVVVTTSYPIPTDRGTVYYVHQVVYDSV